MRFLSLRERHVSSQFDDFSQRIHLAFTNVHLLITPAFAVSPLPRDPRFPTTIQTYGDLNRDRLEHAVYTLIQAAWD